MKKIINYFLVFTIILFSVYVLFLKSNKIENFEFKSSVLNQYPANYEMINLGVPTDIISNAESSDLTSFKEFITINDELGVIYCEIDNDEKIYHFSYSKNLDKFFKNVPRNLIYKNWRDSEFQTLTAGEDGPHSDCMDKCDTDHRDPKTGEKIKGYGTCRFRCWVDTIVTVITGIF